MLDLRTLHSFVTIAGYLNMSRASEVLHISQSALSRQIQALEEDLGVPLFDRLGKRLALTAEGHDLLPRAGALLDQAQQLSSRARAMSGGQVGLLRIGATPQTIEALLSHVLVEFRKRFPAIETSLLEGSNEFLLQQVEAGAAHVAIAALPANADLQGEALFTAALFAVLPPGSALLRKRRIEIGGLAGLPLLMLRKGFMTRSLFDAACARAGLRPHSVLESDSAQTLLALARAGYGVAVVSSTALSRSAADAVPLTLEGRALTQVVSAVWSPRRYQPQVLGPFLEAVKRHVASSPHAEALRAGGSGIPPAKKKAPRREARGR